MKKFVRILAIALAVYLLISVVLSVVLAVNTNRHVDSYIINHRYGLLLMEYDTEGVFVIWSPFNNACDVFLLVADWQEDGLRLVSDGLDAFGWGW